MRIGIDCDGVLADFTKSWKNIVNKLYPNTLSEDYVPHDWYYSDKLTREMIGEGFKQIAKEEDFWLHLKRLDKNVTALARALQTQSDLDAWIITARAPSAGLSLPKQTALWLEMQGIEVGLGEKNYLGVITVADPKQKYPIIQGLGLNAYIDDHGPTIEDLDKLSISGLKPVLLDSTWNQDAKTINRVSNLQEFFDSLKG